MPQQDDDSISVCMATFNGARFLVPQIDSILTQLREGDELLVSDDGSTDETCAILARYGSALRLVGSGRVGGVVRNFSRVLDHSSKALVVLADQDDVWLPGRLQFIRTALLSTDLVLTNALIANEQLEPTGSTLFGGLNAGAGFWRNARRNAFVGCCLGFRRSLLSIALPFPAGTPWHDWLLGLLASAGGRVVLMKTPMLLYRRHGSNASPTGEGSRNSLWQIVTLRIMILYAVAFCLARWRLRQWGAVRFGAAHDE